jgi:two-component sensor histidine kinase
MNKQERKQFILENLIYLIVWLIIFISPVVRLSEQGEWGWEIVPEAWLIVLPFFILFLVNNYVLAPCFLMRRKSWRYAFFLFGCILLFSLEPLIMRTFLRPNTEMFPEQRFNPRQREPFFSPPPAMRGRMPARPFLPPERRNGWMINRFFINRLLIAILMIGFNIAIKFLFKSIRDDRRLRELQKHTLETELNYLKIQISPHFFMNTLNNIHALIDRDAEKAKETIIELSKIMRYVLYDADRPQVLLAQEFQFIVNYVALMRIRYTEQIDIRVQLPPEAPDALIPPLLFFTLIENAFKHGVSYRHDSFIHIILAIEDGRLRCMVANSLHPSRTDAQPLGVGMENMRKRLELLYEGRYLLDVNRGDETFQVTLIIPLQP